MSFGTAPFMANLFFYYKENKQLLDTINGHLHKVRLFSNRFRFINDLCDINDHLEFDRDAFPFSIVCMPHLGCNIPSNICYASTGSEISRCARTTSDISAFVTLSNRHLKRIQKQGSKHTSRTSMSNKTFPKHFTLYNYFPDTAANFITLF